MRRLILVGSVARGEDRPGSDVDVIVEWDGDHEDGLQKMVAVAVDLLMEQGQYASVMVVTSDDLARGVRLGNPFVEAVLDEGTALA